MTTALDRVLAVADDLEREAADRDRMADRLPNQPAYHLEINRLVVAAEHQRRAAKRIRRAATSDKQTVLTERERLRLIQLIDLLNDRLVTQLDTAEEQDYRALLEKLTQ